MSPYEARPALDGAHQRAARRRGAPGARRRGRRDRLARPRRAPRRRRRRSAFRVRTAPTRSCSPIRMSRRSTSRCRTRCTSSGRCARSKPAGTCCARSRSSRHPDDVERAFDAAERGGLVLAEAFMWRHHPQAHRLVELLEQIGELRLIRASFSFLLERAGDVRLQAALDGGALMDVGCYCVSAARLLAGEPLARQRAAGAGRRRRRRAPRRRCCASRGDVLATIDCGLDLAARDELEVTGTRRRARGSTIRGIAAAPCDRAAPRRRLGGAHRGRGARPVRVRARGFRAPRSPASARRASDARTRSRRRARSPRSTRAPKPTNRRR